MFLLNSCDPVACLIDYSGVTFCGFPVLICNGSDTGSGTSSQSYYTTFKLHHIISVYNVPWNVRDHLTLLE